MNEASLLLIGWCLAHRGSEWRIEQRDIGIFPYVDLRVRLTAWDDGETMHFSYTVVLSTHDASNPLALDCHVRHATQQVIHAADQWVAARAIHPAPAGSPQP